MTNQTRVRAVNAADTLNDLVGDFVSGVMLFHEWDAQFQAGRVNENLMVTVQKICLSHLVLGLYKFHEIYRRFCSVIPPEYRDACKGLFHAIEQKGVIDFRKKYVAHIWDRDNQRPLVHSEIMARLHHMTGGNISAFLDWINNPRGNTYPLTVVSIVETVRDGLMAQYNIPYDEFINR